MKQVAELLNAMLQAGVVRDYAVFGAVAQMRYTEAVATLDADILVGVPMPEALRSVGEAVRVGDWPVQFIPAFSPLTEAAMMQADTADFEGIPLRVVRPDYLACIALSVGRAKDHARILALRESGAVTDDSISELAEQYGLDAQWKRFGQRFDAE